VAGRSAELTGGAQAVSEDRKYGGGERRPFRPEPSWDEVLERNAIERLKRDRPPVDALDDLPSLARQHYLDIPEEELVRLKWHGLYHDKPKVGSFMLRIKVPAGVLTPAGLRAIGEVSERYGEGSAELSTRQNVQVHFVHLPDVPAILSSLADAGLTTAGACGDAVRNITGCPLQGVLAGEAFDVTPVVEEAARFFYGHRVYMDLPRKHKITVSACPAQCDMPEINCIALIGVVRDGVEGFAIRVGGGLSTVPRLSRDLGVWIPAADGIPVLRALLDAWREDRRYRISRVKARMKFWVDDRGVEEIREMVQSRVGRELDDGAAPEPAGFADHMGVHEQGDGRFHVGVPVPLGLTSGSQLIEIANLAESAGGDVRLTKQQNLIVANVNPTHRDAVVESLRDMGLPPDANPLRATAIACTGEPHCNYAVTETKGRMRGLLDHLEERWGTSLGSFQVNLDGCPHACALHWVGDIGLMGTTSREPVDGSKQAYDVFLRGGVGPLQAIARPLVRRVPTGRLEAAVDGLIEAWVAGRSDGESFRDFCIRTPDEELQAATAGVAASGGEAA
jgi:sulfite reductase beta subunit-like hemoprotein